MTKHVMAMTYEPKIPAICDGRCRQTIRKGRRFSVGDEVLIHPAGNSCKEWEWWKCVNVSAVLDIVVHTFGIDMFGVLYPWSCDEITRLAELDFIDPATGEALRDVLFGFYGAPTGQEEYQIVRW